MIIREEYTIIFHPVKEYAAMKAFMRDNDMRDFVRYDSTVGVAFKRIKTLWIGAKDDNN